LRVRKPGPLEQRRRTVAILFVVGAVGLLLASRLPFLAHGPDWSILSWEHCFLLSFPMIHENRVAAAPDEPLPYWVVNQDLMRGHYHAGMGWVARAIGGLSHVTGSRGLWLVRLLGTAMTATFVGLLAWALLQVWSLRRQPAQVLVPVFLCAFPTTLFLWASLTPEGHYYDSHLFYGLFLPFYVAVCRHRLSAGKAALAGALGGIALVYTFSNALFVIALLCVHLLDTRVTASRRIGTTALLLVVAFVVVAVLGQPDSILSRLLQSNDLATPGGGATLPFGQWVSSGMAADAAAEHVSCLFGFHGSGIFDGRSHPVGRLVAIGLLVISLAAVVFLAAKAVTLLSRRADGSLAHRFLALHGVLACGGIAAYLLFDPYTLPDDVYLNMSYLLPVYPPVFVGTAALAHRLLSSHRRRVVWATRVLVALLGVLMIAGWANALRINARPIGRPEFQRCDSLHLQGYFWNPPELQHWMDGVSLWGAGPMATLSVEEGRQRCEEHHSADAETCAHLAYVLDALHRKPPIDCLAEPQERIMTCVRAQGAALHGWDTCGSPLTPPEDLCHGFEEPYRATCVSGAYQGTAVNWSVAHCIESYVELCDRHLGHDPVLRASCTEQAAALVQGMPELPAPEGELPPVAVHWPEPWHGLLEDAFELASRAQADAVETSCEEVYYSAYAAALPTDGQLEYDQCLTLARPQYAWCAIGVARLHEDVDCVWRGLPLNLEAYP